MHLVLGVDDSPYSEAAVERVRTMTWPAGTTVTVVRSLPPMVMAVPEIYALMTEQMQQVKKDQLAANERHVRDVARRLSAAGLAARGRALDGDPRATLLEIAHEEKADLIVVGSHGRTGLGKLLMGSVASHVVTHAPCSVLVVRRPAVA